MKVQAKFFGLTVATFFLQACSTTYTWIKPNTPNADYSVDLYDCTNAANSSGAVFNASDYQAPPAVSESPFSNAGCYNPNVSNVNCLSGTPQSMVPQTFDSQLGESSYDSFVERCMKSKGWIKKAE